MTEVRGEGTRAERLDRAIHELLSQTAEVQAAAVVSFDGLPMASALPPGMDEDRVAAMSAALLSLGERATEGLGRGELSQVFIEGENGTVFLVSADNEAVLVAVAVKGAKTGMMLYEVKRAAARVAAVLRTEDEETAPAPAAAAEPAPDSAPAVDAVAELEHLAMLPSLVPAEKAAAWSYGEPASEPGTPEAVPPYAPLAESNGAGTAWA